MKLRQDHAVNKQTPGLVWFDFGSQHARQHDCQAVHMFSSLHMRTRRLPQCIGVGAREWMSRRGSSLPELSCRGYCMCTQLHLGALSFVESCQNRQSSNMQQPTHADADCLALDAPDPWFGSATTIRPQWFEGACSCELLNMLRYPGYTHVSSHCK